LEALKLEALRFFAVRYDDETCVVAHLKLEDTSLFAQLRETDMLFALCVPYQIQNGPLKFDLCYRNDNLGERNAQLVRGGMYAECEIENSRWQPSELVKSKEFVDWCDLNDVHLDLRPLRISAVSDSRKCRVAIPIKYSQVH